MVSSLWPRSSEGSALLLHGNFSNSITADRPSLLRVAPFSSRMTRVGMLLTLNFSESLALASLLVKGTASQGCSAWYSSNSFSALSEEAKTISKFFPCAWKTKKGKGSGRMEGRLRRLTLSVKWIWMEGFVVVTVLYI